MVILYYPGDVTPRGDIVGLDRIQIEGRIWIEATKVKAAERHGWRRTGIVSFDRTLFLVEK